ncbi:MAG: aminoacyl-tRNA hydrolase [Balneolaceae bacterium]
MSLIAGLGNPGAEYTGTRHNVGFDLADLIAGHLSLNFEPGKGAYEVAEGRFKSKKFALIKPTTYVNRSGTAVRKALANYGLEPKECLVCYDDLNLPAGTIRLREKGSAGGHNGIADIIDKLQSDHFPRLRIGIGNDFPKGRQSDFVLSPFTVSERKLIDDALERAYEAVLLFLRNGIHLAMNEYN